MFVVNDPHPETVIGTCNCSGKPAPANEFDDDQILQISNHAKVMKAPSRPVVNAFTTNPEFVGQELPVQTIDW